MITNFSRSMRYPRGGTTAAPGRGIFVNVLDIYVAEHCFGCDEALRLAEEAGSHLTGVLINVRRVDEMAKDDLPDIIATPSYYLNGRLLFLGNPELQELVGKVTSGAGV